MGLSMKLVSVFLATLIAATPVVGFASMTPAGAAQSGSAIGGGPQPVMTQPTTTDAVAIKDRTPAAAQPQQQQPTVVPEAEPAAPAAAGDQGPEAIPAATPAPNVATLPTIKPSVGIGLPDGRMGLQTQVTDIGKDAAWFHDSILIPIIAATSLIVLALLLWVILRYRRAANPVPSRTSHNTVIEVIWTVLPVALLVAIAFPSLGLLARQYAPPKADITVKVIGNQWYWTYQYPDHGGFELVSNMLKERGEVPAGQRFRTDADGPRMLAADERMVVPVNSVVKVIVTSADVMHAFAMPAFWQKMDAVPGRLNETWFKADREGVYFGQCSELCGARHAYMPIAIEVVSPARFAQWVATKGGTMPGVAPARADSTAASPITGEAAGSATNEIGAGDALETGIAPPNTIDAVEKPAVSSQGATDSARSNQN